MYFVRTLGILRNIEYFMECLVLRSVLMCFVGILGILRNIKYFKECLIWDSVLMCFVGIMGILRLVLCYYFEYFKKFVFLVVWLFSKYTLVG